MQFTKLRSMELKHSIVNHFCMQSYGNNIIIDNPVSEAVVLSLNNEPDVAELFPYSATKVSVPKDQLATKLLRDVNLQQIYDNSTVLDQQEFGLDPIFVSECSIEPTKPRLQQVSHTPPSVEQPMLAIISTYGACHILLKKLCDRMWKEQVGNLTQILFTDVFPIMKSPCDLKTFAELRDFVNFYIITACAWHNFQNIIYVANATSYIIAFRIQCGTIELDSKNNQACTFLYKIHTNMGRIGYLKAFDDFIIVVAINGVIHLYQIDNQSANEIGKVDNVEILWDNIDRMCCRQIVIQKSKNNGGYTILFAKGSHIICMQISDGGKLEGRSKLLISGIKITGLELFHENELIVTTITGRIVRVGFSCVMENDCSQSMRLKADPVHAPNFDAENYQILGIGTTANKALWFFITSRNNEQGILTKQVIFPSCLLLCKSNLIDPLTQLDNASSDTMDPYHDLVLALRLDVWHSYMLEKYNQQSKFIASFAQQKILDDHFLRKVQIQLDIARTAFRRSSFKLQTVNEVLLTQIDFLETVIKIIHILLRLQYLQGIIDNERIMDDTVMYPSLTAFQRNSGNSMRNHFYFLIEKLKKFSKERSTKDSINIIKDVTIEFVELALQSFHLKSQDFEISDEDSSLKEECLLCNEILNEEERICRDGHNFMRCCVSFVQIPLFNRRFCKQCGTMALDNQNLRDILTELFPPNEHVKCTLCRSVLTIKEMLQ